MIDPSLGRYEEIRSGLEAFMEEFQGTPEAEEAERVFAEIEAQYAGLAGAEQPVKNAGFEEGMSSWSVTRFWGGSEGRARADKSASHAGKASVRLFSPVRSFGVTSSPIPIVHGQDYEISFWAKVRDFSTGCFPWFMVTFQGEKGEHTGYARFSYSDFAGLPPKPIQSGKWKKYTYAIKSTSSRLCRARTMQVCLALGHPYYSKTKKPGKTVVWYDDVKVIRRAAPLHLGDTGIEFNAVFFKDKTRIKPIVFPVRVANPGEAAGEFRFACLARHFGGEEILREEEELKLKGYQQVDKKIAVQATARGYYDVVFTLNRGVDTVARMETNFAVMEDLTDGKFDDDSPFGFHCHNLEGDGWVMEKMGVKWMRGGFSWPAIEKQKGVYDWGPMDRKMAQCKRLHLRMLPILGGVPGWASSATREQLGKKDKNMPTNRDKAGNYPPKDYKGYEEFMYQFFKRYDGVIRYAEFWNEPDFMYLADPVNSWCGTEAEFTEWMKHGYRGAKRANPASKLLFSGLTTHRGKDRFIKGIMEAGGANLFDVASLHGYENVSVFVRRWDLINSFCDRKRPAWDTEFGVASRSRQQDRKNAGDYVIQNTENLAAGIEKNFYFTFTRGPHPFAMIRGYDDDVARPVLATIPYYIKLMRHARFVRQVDFSDRRSRGYVFKGKDGLFAILWGSPSVGRKQLDVGCPQVRIADVMGKERTVKTHEGVLSMNLTGVPVYVKGIRRLVDVPRELPGGADLIGNGGFEDFYGDPATGLKPRGWKIVDVHDPGGRFELDREHRLSGVWSFVMKPSRENGDYLALEYEIGGASPGKYLLQAFVRTEGLERPAAFGFVAGRNLVEPIRVTRLNSKDFGAYEGTVELKEEVGDLRLQLRVYGTRGGAWFDKVKVCRFGGGKGPAGGKRKLARGPAEDEERNVVKAVHHCETPAFASKAIGVWPPQKKKNIEATLVDGHKGKAWKLTWKAGAEGAGVFINGGKGMLPAGAGALGFWVRGEDEEPFPVIIHVNEGARDQFITTIEVSETSWQRLVIPLDGFRFFWGSGGDGKLTKGDVTQVGFKAKGQGTLYLDEVTWVRMGAAGKAE